MKIDVYCDEAYPDLFSSKIPPAQYMVIGSLWMPHEKREQFKNEIHQLRHQHQIGGEFKWTKISPSKVNFYKNLMSWFLDQGELLRFRGIVVDREKVDLIRFQQNDQELGFYKFYYQVLHKWIHPFNSYSIYSDFKINRMQDRLHTLHLCLSRSNLVADVLRVQAVRSRESVLIQLSDVLVGLTAAKINHRLNEGGAKHQLINHFEKKIGRKIKPTALSEKKMNIFTINLQGGW